ncbi:DNA repair exonuclease [Eggerthellaceae bacterium zg-997]|nr:DNA repair exonuclease [Eggerthellaceae bacterium zg-997]
MARSVTFLHAADLHLGAPFRGIQRLSPAWADRLTEAIPRAYDRVIDAALAHQVDFVVIAGDVFDTSRASYRDYRHFFDGLTRLHRAGIPCYLCTGNHDPFTSWQSDFADLPPSAVMFPADRPGYALFSRQEQPLCLVAGRSYFNQTWPHHLSIVEGIDRSRMQAALDGAQAPFAVGVVHTGLHLDPLKAPSDPVDLVSRGVDYWACGHIHQRYAYPNWDDPRIVYPGCIQGRTTCETGPRGCCLVTLVEGVAPQVSFVPTASIAWQRLNVDVSSARTVAEVEELVTRQLFRENGRAQCADMIARVRLAGATALHGQLCRPDVREQLRQRLSSRYAEFFVDAVEAGTERPRERAQAEHVGLFASQLAACLRAAGESDAARAAFTQAVARQAPEQARDVRALEGALDAAVLDDAYRLALDLLEGVEAE